MFVAFGQQLFGGFVGCIGHHDMVEQLGGPAQIALVECLLRGGTGQVHIPIASLAGSQWLQVRRFAIERAQVLEGAGRVGDACIKQPV